MSEIEDSRPVVNDEEAGVELGARNNDNEVDNETPTHEAPAASGGEIANEADDENRGFNPNSNGNNDEDLEANNEPSTGATISRRVKLAPPIDPAKLLQPIRTDPVKALEARKRRLDRQADSSMPELHYIGQVVGGREIIGDPTQGAFCRWKIEHGKAWMHLGGELAGQTQVAYCSVNEHEVLSFSHPIDAHFAAAGVQGWGAPRFTVQSFKLDWHGRRILNGYGFAHLPTVPGPHRLEINMWRPVGTPEQEMIAFLLGHAPSLISHDPIYESAWKERCRLLTVAAGVVYVDLFAVTRNMRKQGVEGH